MPEYTIWSVNGCSSSLATPINQGFRAEEGNKEEWVIIKIFPRE